MRELNMIEVNEVSGGPVPIAWAVGYVFGALMAGFGAGQVIGTVVAVTNPPPPPNCGP